MKTLLIITMLFCVGILNAQEFVQNANTSQKTVKTIKGQLKSGSDVYANSTFTVRGRYISSGKTDINGYFTLANVMDDDIIEQTQYPFNSVRVSEVTVKVIEEKVPPILSNMLNSQFDTLGVHYMSLTTDGYYSGGSLYSIRSINKDGLKETRSYSTYKGFLLNYTSIVNFSSVGKLPERQSEYAQGQSGRWQGAHQGEIFSWGPKISNLEYDGSIYDYDKNGMLTLAGSGNGLSAKAYDVKDFFKSAVSFSNMMNLKFGLNRAAVSIGLGQQKNNSIIPNSYKEAYNASLLLEKIITGDFTTDLGVIYKSTYDRLNEQSANMASLMYSVLTTPTTFDNTNGLSPGKAVTNNQSWLLANGSQRSYAKDLVNNPYMLVNNLTDRTKAENIIGYLKTRYSYNDFNANASLSFEKEWDKSHNGIMASPFNHTTYRDANVTNASALTDFSFKFMDFDFLYDREHSVTVSASYGFKHTNDKLYRNDNPVVYNAIDNSLNRNAHDVKYGAKLDGSEMTIELFNKHYFSNTLKTDYINTFPEVGFRWNMQRLMNNIFNKYIYLTLYGSSNRSIGESSLVYRNLSALSTNMSVKNFQNYYEYTELFHHKGLAPEIYTKNELGLRYSKGSYSSGEFRVDINGFYYNTHDFISPVFEAMAQPPVLRNIGRLRNYGYYISLDYIKRFNRDLNMNVKLNFSQTRNKVSAVYGQDPYVRLAGFSDIATVFAKNESLGAIYGTSYQRDANGQMIIGGDGFPLVNTTIKKIGDPTPDFVLTAMPALMWKNFDLSFILEYSHGGDRWNGTKAFMDYQGISKGSADLRDTRNHIFEGIDIAGNKNTIPVDFYNETLPLSENKWVRYGSAGVGEDYVEKATYLRLSEISLFYRLNPRNTKILKSLKLGARANNLLFLSSYKGVDPSSLLFGYKTGSALDLFNMPSVKSFSFVVSFEF